MTGGTAALREEEHEMPTNFKPDIGAMRARTQSVLIEFLQADLDTARTMLDIAATEADTDPPEAESARTKAARALATIRQFLPRVSDPEIAVQLRTRADSIEAAIFARVG